MVPNQGRFQNLLEVLNCVNVEMCHLSKIRTLNFQLQEISLCSLAVHAQFLSFLNTKKYLFFLAILQSKLKEIWYLEKQ